MVFYSNNALAVIKNEHLQFLGLKSLKNIRAGGVTIVENSNLCYADTAAWNKILQPASTTMPGSSAAKITIRNNSPNNSCGKTEVLLELNIQCLEFSAP